MTDPQYGILRRVYMPILEFQNVSKVYNNTAKALDNVSFSIDEGEFVINNRSVWCLENQLF